MVRTLSSVVCRVKQLTGVPGSLFFLVGASSRRLEGKAALMQSGVGPDPRLFTAGRLNGGAMRQRAPVVPGSWTCSNCSMGGCWLPSETQHLGLTPSGGVGHLFLRLRLPMWVISEGDARARNLGVTVGAGAGQFGASQEDGRWQRSGGSVGGHQGSAALSPPSDRKARKKAVDAHARRSGQA